MITYTPGKKLVVYIGTSDRWKGQPLYSAIIQECRKNDIAGASAVTCSEGYGSHHVIHTAHLLSLSDNLPVRVEIVETTERFDKVLEVLKGMLKKSDDEIERLRKAGTV